MGRDKAKRKLKGVQSSPSDVEISRDIKGLDDKLEGFFGIGKDERKEPCDKRKEPFVKAFHNPERQLVRGGSSVFKNAKKDLAKEYNWE
jgi:hypothetical protein